METTVLRAHTRNEVCRLIVDYLRRVSVPEARSPTEVIVVVARGLQLLPGMDQAGQDRFVTELVTRPSIELLYEAGLIGISRRHVVPSDVPLLAPAQDCYAGQPGAFAVGDRLGPRPPLEDRCIELTPDPSI